MPKLIQNWSPSGQLAYAKASPINITQDTLVIEASSEQEAKKFFEDNQGFGRPTRIPPYVIRFAWKPGQLTASSTYVGFD